MMFKFLYWTPRLLALVFVAFFSLFALDVFREYQGLAVVVPLLIHLLPSLVLLVIIAVAWKYDLVGALAFLLGAIGYVWLVGLGRPWSWYAAIAGPALVIAVLFFLSWWQRRRSDSPAVASRKQPTKRVLAFGAFDPLHEGHKDFLRQAKALGDHLTVVVAHDSAIRAYKKREPRQSEEDRIAAVKALPFVDEVMLGRESANRYHLLGEIKFDVLALGYNQEPSDEEVLQALHDRGKYQVKLVRLKAYHPQQYPSD